MLPGTKSIVAHRQIHIIRKSHYIISLNYFLLVQNLGNKQQQAKKAKTCDVILPSSSQILSKQYIYILKPWIFSHNISVTYR